MCQSRARPRRGQQPSSARTNAAQPKVYAGNPLRRTMTVPSPTNRLPLRAEPPNVPGSQPRAARRARDVQFGGSGTRPSGNGNANATAKRRTHSYCPPLYGYTRFPVRAAMDQASRAASGVHGDGLMVQVPHGSFGSPQSSHQRDSSPFHGPVSVCRMPASRASAGASSQ